MPSTMKTSFEALVKLCALLFRSCYNLHAIFGFFIISTEECLQASSLMYKKVLGCQLKKKKKKKEAKNMMYFGSSFFLDKIYRNFSVHPVIPWPSHLDGCNEIFIPKVIILKHCIFCSRYYFLCYWEDYIQDINYDVIGKSSCRR